MLVRCFPHGGKSNPASFIGEKKRAVILGGNSILGRFFLGGVVPGLIFSRGNSMLGPFSGEGELGLGQFFRGKLCRRESLCYNTGLSYMSNITDLSTRYKTFSLAWVS